jgi:hypothetical protein
MPVLIQKPQRMIGALRSVENIPPSAHEHQVKIVIAE